MNEIDFTNPPLNLEQECGNGYVKFTDYSSNPDTGLFHIGGEILDESHDTIGKLTIDGFPLYVYQDDHRVNIKYGIELNLEGNIEEIYS
ncbi:MAG: hypothetical protein ACR5LA_00100 [Wolbachia sp.]